MSRQRVTFPHTRPSPPYTRPRVSVVMEKTKPTRTFLHRLSHALTCSPGPPTLQLLLSPGMVPIRSQGVPCGPSKYFRNFGVGVMQLQTRRRANPPANWKRTRGVGFEHDSVNFAWHLECRWVFAALERTVLGACFLLLFVV